MRVQLTLRVPDVATAATEERAREALRSVTAVQSIEALPPAEAGHGIATVIVTAGSDVRDEICRVLVAAGIGVLEVAKQRELESMFLELVGEPFDGEKGRRRRNKRRAEAEGGQPAQRAAASKPEGAPAAAPAKVPETVDETDGKEEA